MGSYASLMLDDIDILDNKSFIPDLWTSLFQKEDIQTYIEIEDDVVVLFDPHEHINDDDDKDEIEQFLLYKFCISTELAWKRLNVMGITPEIIENCFDDWRTARIKELNESIEDGDGDRYAYELEQLTSLNFAGWKAETKEYLTTRYTYEEIKEKPHDSIYRLMEDHFGSWLWFDGHTLLNIGAILLSLSDSKTLFLDFSALEHGGYLEERSEIVQNAKHCAFIEPRHLEPIIIMGEGSSDLIVLKKSLVALFPEMARYFEFFDHGPLNIDGGASYLVKFLKAFGGAKIQSRVIAVFDNDIAGHQARNQILDIGMPSTIRPICLPDIDLANNYPTVGPEGLHQSNINGYAVGIELFLGRSCLTVDGDLTRVRWTGFDRSTGGYSGSVEAKAQVMKNFNSRMSDGGTPEELKAEFPELVELWNAIFKAASEVNAYSILRFRGVIAR